ncbi:hypothetical protein Zmor_006283 [Zophobas morio]|uniref:THAP domain-containing protein 9 n=1 Tax=Zophobas morio TaxID=2755281 RepID=A0AA38IUN4_9CUCU|nr:hypothetical protein Zmor_006283 [Zophobas morio]
MMCVNSPSTSKGERGEKQSSSTVTATESDNGRTSIMRVAKRTHTSSSTLTASETERVLGTRGSFATPTKRRKIINKRYMGDWSSEATITPKKAGVQLRMAKQQLQKQSRQIRNLQQAKRRLKANIFSMKSMLKFFREKNFISSQAEDVIKATQPDESGEIIRRFLRGPSKAKYSPALRAFALTLHFFSAKAYNYIRQKFNKTLPHPRTLSKWYYTIDGSPGFTEESKRALAAKVEETNGKSQILCNLVMDEMAIKRKIEWDGKKFTGYVNIGVELSSDELAEAKEALVFMLVALNGSWKIPIGYFLLEGLSAMEKANLVVKGLEFVHPTGVIVTSLTFDGTPTNLSMAEYLGADFKNYMQFKTWFLHPISNEKLFIFLDACHMLKLLRNCFAVYKQLVDGSGGIIKWQFIEKLVELQEDVQLQLGTKLRKKHLYWSDQPMKVNLAAQTLSNSVSCALITLEDDFKMKEFEGASATALFTKHINDLFDVLNSKNRFCTVELRRGLSQTNREQVFRRLSEIRNYLTKLKVQDEVSVLNCRRKTGFVGFIVCIDSLMGLYNEYVVEKQLLHYILTYKLSQDHLELFFSSMRNRLGMNNNPTAREFERTYKRLIVHTEVGPSGSANVIALDTTSILHCSSATSNTLTHTAAGESNETVEQSVNTFEKFLEDHDYLGSQSWILTDCAEDIVAYIAGFIVKSLQRDVVCSRCKELLEGEEVLSKLQIRKTFGRLYRASNLTVLICKAGEQAVRFLKAESKLFIQNEQTLQALILNIIQELPSDVFQSFGNHVFDGEIWNNHSIELPKLILKKYINLRIYHETSKLSDVRTLRKKLTKTILFRNE